MEPLSSFWVVILLISVSNAQADNEERNCSQSFHFLNEIYRACAPNRWSSNPQFVPLTSLRQVTGGDVIVELQRTCTSLPNLRRCSATSLEGCPVRMHQIYQSAVEVSMWFCDQNNNIKGSVTRALTGSVSVQERQRIKANCIVEQARLDDCPGTLLGEERFRRIRDYGSIIGHNADEVLSDPTPRAYFRELLDCYVSKVYPQCPLNSLPMVLSDQYHLITPPKFGINISELIISTADRIRKETERRRLRTFLNLN